MKSKVVFLLLNLLLVESVFSEIDLSGLPVEKSQSLQDDLQIIQTYFNQIKKAVNSSGIIGMDEFNISSDELSALSEDTFGPEDNAVVADSIPSKSQKYTRAKSSKYSSRLSMHQRDPFAITPRMFEGDPTLQNLGLNFKPDTELEIPEIKLKGVVNGADGKIAALVDVEGVGVIVVREGDTIGVRSKGGGGLRVRKISRTGLILTAGSLGRDVIVK